MTTWDLYLGDIHLTSKSGSKVEYIEVTNSDDSYFQYGSVSTTEDLSTINIGSNARVVIDDTEVFRGYVSKIGRTGIGAKFFSVDLVGETYDLWRYSTPAELEYDNLYTTYIASSLVASYVSGITMSPESLHASGAFIPTIDLSNLKVGDAIAKLTKYDGYKFYVNSGVLYYYQPSTGSLINITESDILDMSPIEESDEDIVNVCKVIGGTGYSSKTKVDDSRKSPIYFFAGDYVAQQFTATDEQLSAIQLYLDRTKDPNQPGNLDFEIWENTEMILFQDSFDNWNYLDSGNNSYNMNIYNSNLELSHTEDKIISGSDGSSGHDGAMGGNCYCAIVFKVTSNCYADRVYFWGWLDYDGGSKTIYADIRCTGSTGAPDGELLADGGSLTWKDSYFSSRTGTWTFHPKPYLQSGNSYAVRIWFNGGDYYKELHLFYQDGNPKPNQTSWYKGDYYEKTNGQWEKLPVGCDYYFKLYTFRYKTSGVIYSKSYNTDTRYIRVDLDGITSGNCIKISGTNDGGTTWKELTDGSWVDFGSESSAGSFIKYKFSSNGYFTPRIDSATLTISDESGGFELEIYSDDFNDSSQLSGSSFDNIQVDGDYLKLDYSSVTINSI